MPPGLAATSSAQQTFDYDFERQVMSNDASASFDAFLAKPEVNCPWKWSKTPATQKITSSTEDYERAARPHLHVLS
jgi:hypothetical protein